ncbi:MAG: phosphotransferase family protein [Actinomycetota bacterium]
MSDAPGSGTDPGLDRAALDEWLPAHVAGLQPPFRATLVAAGGSNLTYRVDDAAGHAVVLRRPPVTAVLATAHDRGREWRILDALHRHTDLPVPTPRAYCGDLGVIGAPFTVMDFVEGRILRTPADSAGFTAAEYATATDSLVAVQAALHAVDVDAVGLGDLARTRTDYVARQLHRWMAQLEQSRTRDLPVVDEVHATLAASIPPESGPPGLVHGDHRFDNCVLGPDGAVVAVLDWELATLGDPVADFAWSCCYWTDPGDPAPFLDAAPTLDPGFPDRATTVERYARASGRDLAALPWLEAFSYWKMGCLVEGVYARRLRGAAGGAGVADPGAIAERAERFLRHAAVLLSRIA